MNIFEAIAYSIFSILWQSAIVYLLFMVWYKMFFKDSKTIYVAAIFSQVIIFLLFITDILYFYNQESISILSSNILRENKASEIIFPIITWTYFLLLIVSVFKTIKANYSYKLIINKSSEITDFKIINYINSKAEQLKIYSKIRIISGEKINMVFTKNFWKPIIYLPASIITQLSAEQLETILLHELIHIKRHDYLINLIQIIIEKILYFNPLVKIIGNIARKQREIICDNEVILQSDKINYSEALLIVAKNNQISGQLSPVFAAGNTKNELLERIKIMHEIKTDAPKFNGKLIGINFLIVLIFILFNPTQNQNLPIATNLENLNEIKTNFAVLPNENINLPREEIKEEILPAQTNTAKKLIKTSKVKKDFIAKKIKDKTNTNSNNQLIENNKIDAEKIIFASQETVNPKNESVIFVAKNNYKELQIIANKLNTILQGENLQYQAYQISNIETAEGVHSSSINVLKTDNYDIEVEQNSLFTKIKLTKISAESLTDNLN